jgi:two-component system CheB/CheR fusion protein
VLQKKVLRILHYALSPDGFLLLGTSETVGDLPDLFGLVDRKNKIYVKKNVTAPPTFALSFASVAEDRPATAPPPPRGPRPVPTMHQLVDRRLLDRYVPPGVLVNEALEILQYHGRTGPYLEPSAGAATLHVLRNTRPELQAELRAQLHRARAEKVAVTGAPIPLRIKETGVTRNVTIEVLPVEDSATRSQCQLVVFRESAPVATTTPVEGTKDAKDTHLLDVERELVTTKEYLQSTIEELETSNEELKSSNEELQSSNEELQSTNEELETSKEELQSSNEELTTVNDELHNRMLELGQSNDDLANVLSSVELAVIIVGMDRRIRRFNSKAEKLLNLVAGDVGRSVGHLAAYVKNADLRQIVDKVITGVAAAQQAVTINESWFLMRAIPYMTSDHAIRGAVVLLQRIDEELPTLDQALGAAQSAGATLVSIKHPLLILDEDLRVVWANATFYEKFHVDAREIAGRPLPQPWAHPKLLEKLQQTATTNVPFKNFSVSYGSAGAGQRAIKVEGSVIPAQGGQGHQKLILMVLDEQTPPKASVTKRKVRRPSAAKPRRGRT